MPSRTPSFRLVKSSQLPRRLRRLIGCVALPLGVVLVLPATFMGWHAARRLYETWLLQSLGPPYAAVGNSGWANTGVPRSEIFLWTVLWGVGALIIFVAVRDIICWRHEGPGRNSVEDEPEVEPTKYERQHGPG